MMVNNLIFIEGVSGVGKTTATSLLCNKLSSAGDTFACYLEGNRDNPLDPFKGTYPPAMPITAFTELYAVCWKRFMESQFQQKQRFIMDGTLMHHLINDLVRNYDASGEDIVTCLTCLLQIIQPMNPVVFYLTSRDIGKQLQHAYKSRGKPIPSKEKISFWENRRYIDLFVLHRLSVESHILSIDNGWDRALETMTEYISQ